MWVFFRQPELIYAYFRDHGELGVVAPSPEVGLTNSSTLPANRTSHTVSPSAERTRKYRAKRTKEQKAARVQHAEYMRKYRKGQSESQRERGRLLNRARTAEYRKRQREKLSLPTVMTRRAISEKDQQKQIWREQKRKQRANMTPLARRRRREKDRRTNKEQRQKARGTQQRVFIIDEIPLVTV